MQTQIDAALKAAKAYKPRNDIEEIHAGLVVACLSDASARAGMLDKIVEDYDKTQRLLAAQAELAAAQQG